MMWPVMKGIVVFKKEIESSAQQSFRLALAL
jgi:hypothetical protein